ncbi:hypothetical protein HRH25_04545 [Flavisolibacter sp. BT320]|nr:hypothetical protein [Flavisolibacter longurius]
MKRVFALRYVWIIGLFAFALVSCKKELRQQQRAFKVTTDTWYRVSPTQPQPLTIGGVNYLGILHFPGGGTGNATHLGKCITYFNQLAYIQPPGDAILGSVAAPLVDIPSYPVAGDFTELASAISSLGIPETVNGHVINHVIYNKKGEAIFTTAIAGGGSTFPVSATKIGFNGKGLILGGTGKFVHATGEFAFDGYFNPTDPSDAAYNADGWIDY